MATLIIHTPKVMAEQNQDKLSFETTLKSGIGKTTQFLKGYTTSSTLVAQWYC